MAAPVFAFTIETTVRNVEMAGAVGLAGLQRRISDLRPSWLKVAEAVRLGIGEAFASEGNAAGQWLPLTPKYASWKRSHFPGRKILELTGRLKGSLVSGAHPDAITTATATTLFISSRVPYGKYHQQGTTKMVARPPLALTAVQKSRIAAAIHKVFGADVNRRPVLVS